MSRLLSLLLLAALPIKFFNQFFCWVIPLVYFLFNKEFMLVFLMILFYFLWIKIFSFLDSIKALLIFLIERVKDLEKDIVLSTLFIIIGLGFTLFLGYVGYNFALEILNSELDKLEDLGKIKYIMCLFVAYSYSVGGISYVATKEYLATKNEDAMAKSGAFSFGFFVMLVYNCFAFNHVVNACILFVVCILPVVITNTINITKYSRITGRNIMANWYENKKLWIVVACILALFIFQTFLRYEYKIVKNGNYVIKIDKLTGNAEKKYLQTK